MPGAKALTQSFIRKKPEFSNEEIEEYRGELVRS